MHGSWFMQDAAIFLCLLIKQYISFVPSWHRPEMNMPIIILLTIKLNRDAREFRIIQSVLARLRSGRPSKRSSMPGRYKWLLSTPKCLGRLWGLLRSCSVVNGAIFPGVKWARRKADCYLRLASRLRMSGGHYIWGNSTNYIRLFRTYECNSRNYQCNVITKLFISSHWPSSSIWSITVQQDMYFIPVNGMTQRWSDSRRSTRIIRHAVCHLNLRLHAGYGESELTYGEIYNLPFFPCVSPLLTSVILRAFMEADDINDGMWLWSENDSAVNLRAIRKTTRTYIQRPISFRITCLVMKEI